MTQIQHSIVNWKVHIWQIEILEWEWEGETGRRHRPRVMNEWFIQREYNTSAYLLTYTEVKYVDVVSRSGNCAIN